jgi:hypothetical protein
MRNRHDIDIDMLISLICRMRDEANVIDGRDDSAGDGVPVISVVVAIRSKRCCPLVLSSVCQLAVIDRYTDAR